MTINAKTMRSNIVYSLCGPKAKPIGINPKIKSTPPEILALPSDKAVCREVSVKTIIPSNTSRKPIRKSLCRRNASLIVSPNYNIGHYKGYYG